MTKSTNPVVLSVMHHRQNPLDSTWFHLAQDRDQWSVPVNTIMNPPGSRKVFGNS
jgi:hypothetical protein